MIARRDLFDDIPDDALAQKIPPMVFGIFRALAGGLLTRIYKLIQFADGSAIEEEGVDF